MRLVAVTGHSKNVNISQESMPGWLCLPGMALAILGKAHSKEESEVDVERWHRVWTDAQINKAVCGQTLNLSMGCHPLHTVALCQASLRSALVHKHTRLREWQKNSRRSLLADPEPFFFYTCLINFSTSLFSGLFLVSFNIRSREVEAR